MKVLLYGINFAPELTGVGKYSGELADWLARQGHDLRVVTAPPYYPEWKVRIGFSQYRFSAEIRPGLRILRCPIWVPNNPNGLLRILHLASFALSSIPAVLKQALWRPDLVMVIAPTLFCAPMGWLVAKISGGKSWLHFQDFESDAAFALGVLKGQKRRALAELIERILLRGFDCVSSISEKMVERLALKGVAARKSYLLANWVDVDQIYPTKKPNRLRAELGIPESAVLALYSGNMGRKQGLDILAEVAESLRDRPDILFLFSGTGAGRPELWQACGHLPNVRFIDLQPLERLNDLLNAADIHLLPQRADAADLVMPSKLTGMLASGRPVVATAAPGTQIDQVLAAAGGLCVAPGDLKAMRSAILHLVEDAADRVRRGNLARAYALDHLSRDPILQALSQKLHDLHSADRAFAPKPSLRAQTLMASLRRWSH